MNWSVGISVLISPFNLVTALLEIPLTFNSLYNVPSFLCKTLMSVYFFARSNNSSSLIERYCFDLVFFFNASKSTPFSIHALYKPAFPFIDPFFSKILFAICVNSSFVLLLYLLAPSLAPFLDTKLG